MWAIDNPLSENVTGSSDDFRWVEDAKGSAVPENQMYRCVTARTQTGHGQNQRVVRDTPRIVLNPICHVMRVEQVNEVGMRTIDDKIKAKCL